MSILIAAHQLRKSFAARPLFDGLTFSIESGERIGLIGPNGAGKSTLLKILAGKASPDEGTLSISRGLRVGYLEQVPSFTPDATVQSSILEGTRAQDSWESLALAQELMARLGLSGTSSSGVSAETQVARLSGGWKKRVALARELACEPDLLLLDEPTNHLDVESILWLEDFIAKSPFATLTITHDRLFLQRISRRILELDRRNPGGLLSVQGDYATYLEVKEQVMSAQERQESALRNTLRRETEWLRRGAKARTTKQQARIKRAEDLKEEVGELEYRNRSRTARFDFQQAEKHPKKLVEAKRISKSYGEKTIFAPLDLLLSPGMRIGLLGPNGSGKSTLIRVLLGLEPSDSGEIHRSEHLQIAYFEQNRESLDPLATVFRTICPVGDHVEFRGARVHARGYLDRFLFSPGQMEMAVGKLSGGEQSRLLIARLMLKEANVLVLDEPTNDLDLATLGVLEECLHDFPGAVLLVTHDRYFLDQVCNRIYALPGDGSGEVIPFASLEQWELWRSERARAASGPIAEPQAATTAVAKKRKLSYKDQRELDSMESVILEKEARLAALTAESNLPENASHAIRLAELTTAMHELQTEIDALYSRWAELEG